MSAALSRALEETWGILKGAGAARPPPSSRVLVVMVGPPLSGKSTLARALARAARTEVVLVENDALRARLASAMGRGGPHYDAEENFLTYRGARALVERALSGGASAIHDATNLQGSDRRNMAVVADAHRARPAFVYVRTSGDAIASRLRRVDEDRRRAHEKLGAKQPQPPPDLPHLVVDGGLPVEENLGRLREWPPLGSLFEQGED